MVDKYFCLICFQITGHLAGYKAKLKVFVSKFGHGNNIQMMIQL